MNSINLMNASGKLQKGYQENVMTVKNLCTAVISEGVSNEEQKVQMQRKIAAIFDEVVMVMLKSDLEAMRSRRF